MVLPALFREARGDGTVTFEVTLLRGRSVTVEAVSDPMELGVEVVAAFAGNDFGAISRVLTPRGELRWWLAFPQSGDAPALCVEWAKACGFGEYGFARLRCVVEHLDLVEADFQRFYGADLGQWARGEMSTRRVLSLVNGLESETASLFWSELRGQNPLSREAIVLAQFASSPGSPHDFLVTPAEREQLAADQEAVERIRKRGF